MEPGSASLQRSASGSPRRRRPMSLDRRLREGLLTSSAAIDEQAGDLVLASIVRGADRRRFVRRALAAAVVLAVVLAAFVLTPRAIRALRSDRRLSVSPGIRKPLVWVPGYGFGFSADGGSLFARALDSSGAIYDAGNAALAQTVSGRGEGVTAFSPDGS